MDSEAAGENVDEEEAEEEVTEGMSKVKIEDTPEE
jgi:hypothetical protein